MDIEEYQNQDIAGKILYLATLFKGIKDKLRRFYYRGRSIGRNNEFKESVYSTKDSVFTIYKFWKRRIDFLDHL